MSKHQSNGRKAPIEPLPNVPAIFCDTFRYNIENGVLTLWGGMGRDFHGGLAFPIGLTVDLYQKLGVSLAEVIRQQAGVAPSPEEKSAAVRDTLPDQEKPQ